MVTIDEPQALISEHPGVLAAHPGPVTEEECGHPAGRRDGKNPRFCRACGRPVPEGIK